MSEADLLRGLGRGARLIAESGALTSPFILIDVGARDGIHPRWEPLMPVLEVYGYDASVQVKATSPRHHYVMAAIGERDGEARIELHNGYEAKVSLTGSILVPMHKLDSLYARGELPKADFIKIDCEGYEPEILDGAKAYLSASLPFGVEVETNFDVTRTTPESHFVEMFKRLNRYNLFVAHLAFESATNKSTRPWPGTGNALFMRKCAEQPSADALLKLIAVCDVYGLYRQARVLIETYHALLEPRLDILELHSAVSPSKLSLIVADWILPAPRFVPHLGLGLWSTAARFLKKVV
jgi:FkbM family methyltransferase